MVEFGKILGLLALSAVKSFFAPSVIVLAGYAFIPTLVISSVGGIIGFFLFYRFGKIIRNFLNKLFRRQHRIKINKRNRRIINIKNNYGIFGVAILTPCLLSIPVGALIAAAYFSKDKRIFPIFYGSILIWSIILSSIATSLLA